MRAAILSDRGVVKVVGDGARNFLHGLLTANIQELHTGEAKFCPLLTPQCKIVTDFIVTLAPAEHACGFFLDVPGEETATPRGRLNLYKLRAKGIVEDLSDILGVLAAW